MSSEAKRNVYVGHRYVPKIFDEWDKTQTYEGLSIVTYQGTSYTSKKRVPVGIDVLNKEYWAVTGNYNAQVETYREEVRRVQEDLDSKASKQEMTDFQEDVQTDLSVMDTSLKDNLLATTGSGVVYTGRDNFGTYGDLRVAARPTANMTVNVYPGTVYMPDGQIFHFPSSTILTAPPKETGVRKDIVFVSSDGVLSYLAGDSMNYPSMPSGGFMLAEIEIETAAIYGRNIIDKRVLKYTNTQLREELLRFKNPFLTDGAVTSILNTALTYVDRQNFVYGNNKTLYNADSSPDENGFYEIDCSSFVIACLQGITFERSKYINSKNFIKPNAIFFPESYFSPFDARLLANDMAKYAYESGYLFQPNHDWSNVRVGDVIFWSNSPQQHFFKGIGHVQIVSRIGQNGEITVYHAYAGNSVGQVIEEKTYTTAQLANSRAYYCARIPIGDRLMNVNCINEDRETTFSGTGWNLNTYLLTKELEENKTYTAFIKAHFSDSNAYPWLRTFDEKNIYSFSAGVEKQPDNWYKVTFRIRDGVLDGAVENKDNIRLSAVNNTNGGTVEAFYLMEGYFTDVPFL